MNRLDTAAVPADVAEQAERILVAEADRHTPRELARLGDRILELIDPDTFEDHERRLLDEQLRQAEARLSMRAAVTEPPM